VLDIECFLQAPARLKQPVSPILGNRAAFALALGVEPAAPLTHPSAPALWAGHEPAGVELDSRRLILIGRQLVRLVAFARQAFLGLAQRLASALARAQLLGQLVTAPVAVELVLTAVDFGRLGEDLARDLAELAVGVA